MSESVDDRNRATSAAEVAAFRTATTAGPYFAYWCGHEPGSGVHVIPPYIATWTGDKLADVTWFGVTYKSPAFGRASTRVNFRARGIDGREWFGTYYKSAGNYVRMRPRRKRSDRD